MVQEAMNTRFRSAVQTMKASPKRDKEKNGMKTEAQRNCEISIIAERGGSNRCQSRREKKIALQQVVEKLRKKLRLEESVRRALERAFTRPVGVLPRLSPCLPSHTLELLAEVAVLEEEVVRLEEKVASFRQGLYQEAIYFSSSKRTKQCTSDSYLDWNNSLKASELMKPCLNLKPSKDSSNVNPSSSARRSSNLGQKGRSSCTFISEQHARKKFDSSLTCTQNAQGKKNSLDANSPRNLKQSLSMQAYIKRASAPEKNQTISQTESWALLKDIAEISALNKAESNKSSGPNKLSEDIISCLMNIFLLMESSKSKDDEPETSPAISGSHESSGDIDFRDPYGICRKFGRRDIGPYKHFQAIEMNSSRQKLVIPSSILTRRLRILLRKLVQVDLTQLTHQQKLAFWINIYNSCIMNTFLEQGIPVSPEMVVKLMQKATINVGGHLLRAMTIEHFILRLPYYSKLTPHTLLKINDVTRGSIGLDWPEPLVTFALSYGSWSSPAVRVYTASQVENELEAAKRDYLQATVGISTSSKLAIPKLIDWYLLDFAKDMESLMDWICLQLPSELRSDAVKCIEMSRVSHFAHPVQILPYEFSFRYLFVP